MAARSPHEASAAPRPGPPSGDARGAESAGARDALWRAARRTGPLALFTIVGPALGALALAGTADGWLPPLEARGSGALPWLVVATVVLAGLSLAPTHAASLVAGLLFGPWLGSAAALAGVAGAAVLGFAALRRLVGDRWLAGLAARPRARAVHDELLRRSGLRATWLISLVRLSPVVPFAATNLLLAASGVSLRVFLAGTVLGLAPRVVAVAVAGAGLAELDLSRGADVRIAIVGAVALVVALVAAGSLGRRALARAAIQES